VTGTTTLPQDWEYPPGWPIGVNKRIAQIAKMAIPANLSF
jgi:hypothetical protein